MEKNAGRTPGVRFSLGTWTAGMAHRMQCHGPKVCPGAGYPRWRPRSDLPAPRKRDCPERTRAKTILPLLDAHRIFNRSRRKDEQEPGEFYNFGRRNKKIRP